MSERESGRRSRTWQVPDASGRAVSENIVNPTFEFAADAASTLERQTRLDVYMREHVLSDGRFLCSSGGACRGSLASLARSGTQAAFHEGQLHHVGDAYDLRINRQQMRVVVVGQDYGDGPARVDREQRSREVVVLSGQRRRFSASDGFDARDLALKGTTSVLRLLFGHYTGDDYDGEFIDIGERQKHIFEAFALVNFLLCSAVDASGPAARVVTVSTPVMQEQCTRHFKAALQILQPTVVVLLGKTPLANWIAAGRVFERAKAISRTLSEARLDGQPVLIAGFANPSARVPHNWGANEESRYLRTTVLSTIREIHRRHGLSGEDRMV